LFADAVGVTGSGAVDLQANAVANDASGNVTVTGSLVGTANFAQGSLTTNVSSSGGRDVYLARYNKSGALVWAVDLPSNGAASVAQGSAVVVDPSGNTTLTGTFTGTVNFDPSGPNASATFSAPGRNDAFVARYDPIGRLVWARDFASGAGMQGGGYAVAADASGNVAVAGSFQGTATFGATTLTAAGTTEGFVAKLDPSGNILWVAKTTGSGSSTAQVSGVAIDASGNVVETGFYAGSVNFNPGPGATTLTAVGSRDAFVARLTPTGSLAWAKGYGSPDVDQGNAVVADSSGNVYITGFFSGPINFDPGASNTTLSPGGFYDGFLLKLTAAGQFSWAKDLAVTGYNSAQGTGVGVDGAGNVYVGGFFMGQLTLDPTASGATLTSAGSYDSFIAAYGSLGGFGYARSDGGSNYDAASGLSVNASGQVAFAGRYSGPAAFAGTTLPAMTNRSLFVAEMASNQNVTAPPAPAPPALEAASDTGLSSSDGITNLRSITLDVGGVSAPTNTVQLLRDGAVVASCTGGGALTDPGPVPDGTHTYTAVQVNGGLTSPASVGTKVTVITSTLPTPAAPVLLASDDSGVQGDNVTSVRSPHLTGTAAAGSLAQLLDSSGNVVASTVVASSGSFSLQPPSPLADGTYSFRFRDEDVAGNFSAASAAVTLVIDGTPPVAPTAPALLPADDTGVVGDNATTVTQPRLIGTSEAGATVQLLNAAGAVIGTAVAGSGGAYTVAPSSPLSVGVSVLSVRAVDAAGNVGPSSAALSLTILASVPTPATPTLLPADDSGVVGDNTTNVRQPRVTGTVEPASTAQLLDGFGNVIAFVTAGSDGTYVLQCPVALPDGSNPLSVRELSTSGLLSAASAPLNLTIDTTPPAAPPVPTLQAAPGTVNLSDVLTIAGQARVIGTTEANATVRLVDATGAVLGTVQADGTGAYTMTPTAALSSGTWPLRVLAVDLAGNVGPTSGPLSLVTFTAPPTGPVLSPTSDTGVLGDNITSATQPALIGTAMAGLTVELLDRSENVLGRSVASGNGAYTVSPSSPLAAGVWVLHTMSVDASGTAGRASAVLNLTVMTATPAMPASPTLLAADDSGVLGDGLTNVRRPRLTGRIDAGATAQLLDGSGAVIASVTAGSDGSYVLQPPTPLPDGPFTLSVREQDVAGNLSAASAPLHLVIDSTPPAAPPAPVLLAADDTGLVGDGRTSVRRPRLTGTTTPGFAVDLIDANGSVVASTTAAGSGVYTVQPPANLPFGASSFRVVVHDLAGNVSAPGSTANVTVVDASPGDFNGDGRTDLGVFRPSTATWLSSYSSGGGSLVQAFGNAGQSDIPVPGDYDGAWHAQMAVFRPSTSQWVIAEPDGTQRVITFGAPNLFDIPVPGDYDGVGYTEPAVFRPSTGQWFVLGPRGGHLVATFGGLNLTDIPVPGDYDGIGHTEPAVFRPSTSQWIVLGPAGGHVLATFGAPNLNDIPVPGDYDGVGHTEPAIFRPSTSQWMVLGPAGGHLLATFGSPNLFDLPLEAPIGALKKLGKVGTLKTASVNSTASAARSAADTVAPSPATKPATAPPAQADPIVARVPVRQTRQEDDLRLLDRALEGLFGGW
jgi:hypothetical protein